MTTSGSKTRLLTYSFCTIVVVFGLFAHGSGQSNDRSYSIVYPVYESRIRVNHAHPKHRALSCVRCHRSSRRSRTARERLIPPDSTCESCHEARIDRDRASAENCGFCHRGYDPAVSKAVPLSNLRTPRVHFSHAQHAQHGVECKVCHRSTDPDDEEQQNRLPDMRFCAECHNTEQGSGCSKCHLTDPGGRLRTRFAEGRLKPPDWLLGMRHDRQWVVRHRWVGADHGEVCAACHKERDCMKCHDGRRRPSTIHPNDWLTLHAQKSRRRTPRCTSCHTTQTFCAECHLRLGIALSAAPNVRSRRRFHPPKSEWIEGTMRHAREAKRALSSCTSCHVERDCVICHGSRGVGRGISPHQKGFDKKCGAYLRKNSRACTVCHRDIDSIIDRCQK
jgi:hypothetical protein